MDQYTSPALWIILQDIACLAVLKAIIKQMPSSASLLMWRPLMSVNIIITMSSVVDPNWFADPGRWCCFFFKWRRSTLFLFSAKEMEEMEGMKEFHFNILVADVFLLRLRSQNCRSEPRISAYAIYINKCFNHTAYHFSSKYMLQWCVRKKCKQCPKQCIFVLFILIITTLFCNIM